jgi:hypothetical protein
MLDERCQVAAQLRARKTFRASTSETHDHEILERTHIEGSQT